MRRLLGEPLVHFFAIGLVLFLLHPSDPPPNARERIVIDAHVREELIERWRKTHSGTASPEELARLTEAWIDREVLYREGVARGLHLGDARIRAWVAEKMAFVLSSQAAIPEPGEAELRELFSAEPERFATEELVDFVHVFVRSEGGAERVRASELLRLLEGGASPNGLGDTFSGGRYYRRRRIQDLAQTFGDDFVRGLELQELGKWVMRPSRFGLHLLRIEQRTPAAQPDFESVRLRVRDRWRERETERAVAGRIAELRAKWEIIREP
jgi:hypothetical protein